jgi:hydrogenase maturation factor
MGKLGTEDLKKLLSCIKRDPRVIVPPMPGFDSGVHALNHEKYLVVSTDPCIGVPEEWFGWLLIHYAASDVALFGAKPEFCTISLLGPPQTKPEIFCGIMKQTCKAADDLGIAIVTGHTGTYEGLSNPVGVCTAYGTVNKDKLITPDRARPGDCILCTKPIGLEIAVNFAVMHEKLARQLFGIKRTRELSKLVSMQSCVKEALMLADAGGVHALHDATEGGLTASLNEMAEASNVGFKVDAENIPIPREAYLLQKQFNLSYEELLSMSSTGTILAAIEPTKKDKILKISHKNGIDSKILGIFTKNTQHVLLKNGKERLFPQKAYDPYERILSGKV